MPTDGYPTMTAPQIAGLALLFALPLSSTADAAPAKLEGTWTWEWKDGQGTTHHHKLVVEGSGAAASARERFDDLDAVKVEDFKVDGKKVTFSVKHGDRMAAYSGTLGDDDTINGLVTVTVAEDPANEFAWTAKRKATEKP